MDVQSLAWRTDLALRGASGSVIDDRGDHLLLSTPTNPTYHWGNVILLRDPPAAHDVPRWLELFEKEFPDSRHRSFGVDGGDRRLADLDGFRECGLGVEASAVMTARDVREPTHPNTEAGIRPLVSDDDWVQQVQLALTDEDLVGGEEFAHQRSLGERRLVEDGHGRWFGAFVDGRLASSLGIFMASPGLARYQGVQTDPAYRGRGLCGTLVHHAGRYALDRLAAHTLVMVADPTYSAIRIYRAAGFAETEVQLQAARIPRG